MAQQVVHRGSVFLVFDQALLDEVDAFGGAVLEHLFLKLRFLVYNGRVEAETCATREMEGRKPGKNFVRQDSDSKDVSLLCDERGNAKSKI